MQRRGQLYNVDPDEAGPLIYAQINSASNGELADYLAKAKAQRKAERDRMLERAKEKQVGASPAAAPSASCLRPELRAGPQDVTDCRSMSPHAPVHAAPMMRADGERSAHVQDVRGQPQPPRLPLHASPAVRPHGRRP